MQNSIVLAHVLTKKQDYDEPEHATGCDEPEHAADPQTKETVIKPRIWILKNRFSFSAILTRHESRKVDSLLY